MPYSRPIPTRQESRNIPVNNTTIFLFDVLNFHIVKPILINIINLFPSK